jgi:hypothetical protein
MQLWINFTWANYRDVVRMWQGGKRLLSGARNRNAAPNAHSIQGLQTPRSTAARTLAPLRQRYRDSLQELCEIAQGCGRQREPMEVFMAQATTHPNHQLISSEDVEGTEVYDAGGNNIGE